MNTLLTSPQQDGRAGIMAALVAYTWWGLIPLYFVWTKEVPPWELIAQRVVWSIVFAAIIIHFRKQWREVYTGLVTKQVLWSLVLSAAIISINWVVFITAIQEGQVFQSSLGYYINPLFNILLGAIFLHEALRRLQWVAVALAAIGVAVLSTVGDAFPTYALIMAVSFTAYGYIRKHMTHIAAIPGLFIETLVLLPLAVIYLVYLAHTGQAVVTTEDMEQYAVVMLIGPVSLTPLLAFAYAARRLRLSTLGFLQFIGPTLHFIVGYTMGESFTTAHQICFVLIWCAAVVMMVDLRKASRGIPNEI